MNDKELKEIKERADAATPGPWVEDRYFIVNPEEDCLVADCGECENAKFIAHARADIPALLNEIDIKNAEIERLREALMYASRALRGSNDRA